MRDFDDIHKILSSIEIIWREFPDMRLGQLITNVFPNGDYLYYTSDDKLITELTKYYNSLDARYKGYHNDNFQQVCMNILNDYMKENSHS